MVFGERLKKLRARRYSQEELANLINVHSNTIFRWENGESMPNTSRMSKLAEILDTSAAYLMGETDDPRSKSAAVTNVNTLGDNHNSNVVFIPHEFVNSENAQSSRGSVLDMSYWGGVINNARELAKSGSSDDVLSVAQMLERALRLLRSTVNLTQGATA